VRCLFPCGKRGLKYPWGGRRAAASPSLPVREEGVEIIGQRIFRHSCGSLPVREEGVEIPLTYVIVAFAQSLPVREEGVEIAEDIFLPKSEEVSSRAGRGG